VSRTSRALLTACLSVPLGTALAVAAAPPVATETYAASESGRIYYRAVGSNTAPPVILVAGGPGGNRTAFVPWFERLEGQRPVVYFDAIGRGRSDALPPTHQHSVSRDAQDIEAVRVALNVPRIVLLGNSYGTLPVIEYSLQHPERVACMVLSSGMHSDASFQAQIDNLNGLLAAQYPAHWSRLQEMTAGGVLSGEAAYQSAYGEVADRLYWWDPRNAIKRVRSADARDKFSQAVYLAFIGADPERRVGGTLKGYDPRGRMLGLRVPALVITGRQDPVATPRIAAETAAAFPPGMAKVVVVELAGHRPFIEQPEAYFSEVSRFLTETPACGAIP
jgi:proline iminopeptidase